MTAEGKEKQKNSSSRWFIVLFAILAASILSSGYLFYRNYEQHYRADVELQLAAIAELKVAELLQWRSERMADSEVLYENATLSRLVRRYFNDPQDRESKQLLGNWLNEYPQHYEYDQVCLLDPQGAAHMSFPPGRPAVSAAVKQALPEAIQSRRITIVDLYRHDRDQRIYLSVLIPILDASAGNRAIGIIALQVDPEKYLYPFILRWPTPSRTAETMLVRRDGNDVLYLSELKFLKQSALHNRFSLDRTEKPAVQAVLGKVGIVEGIDYHGERVIADVRNVPNAPWFLVTRINSSEVFAPVRGQIGIIVGSVAALLFGAGAGLAFVWRRQQLFFYREQYRSAEALRESEESLALTIRSIGDAVIATDIEGRVTRMNPAAEHLCGWQLEHAQGMLLTRILHLVNAETRAVVDNPVALVLKSGKVVGLANHTILISRNGTEYQIADSAAPILDRTGNIKGVILIFSDITERYKADEALRRSSAFVKETQIVAGLGSYDLDLIGGTWLSSDILDSIFGIDEKFSRSVDGWVSLVHPDDREDMLEYFTHEVVGKRQRFDREYRIIGRNDGVERWVHGLGRLELNARNQPVRMIGTIQDITARKQADKKLGQSEALYHDLVETSQDLIWQCDSEGRYTYLNPAWEAVFGYTTREMLGKKFTDFQRPEDAVRSLQEFSRLWSEGTVTGLETTHLDRNGRELHLVFNAKAVCDEQGRVIGTRGTAYDITDRRRSEELIENILECVDEGFIIIDRDFRILSANRAYATLVKGHPEKIVGRHCYEVSHHLSAPCDGDRHDCAVKVVFETGRTHTSVHAHRDATGGMAHIETKAYPLARDGSGQVVTVIETLVDTSDRHRLEEQLRQSQKMEGIGQLAGGIAHDFNNILSAIIGYGHIALMKMPPEDPQRRNIEHMLEAGDRAAHLTRDLLLFSRKQTSERKPVDLNEIIRKVEKFLVRVIGEDIECRTTLSGETMPVLGDAHQLEQVLMNLATNARDAMSSGGIFTVTTAQVRFDKEFISVHGYGRPGAYVLITVSDTGKGMDDATREHIFEPFFTTKDAGKGTGLGLAVVYGIIKQHDGFINVYSEPGRGTTFRLYLPIVVSKIDSDMKVEQERPPGGTETILVAEDDETVRAMTVAVLEDFGYNVIAAVDGQNAVDKYRENRDGVQLLVFDIIMPRKTGKEAYDEIKAIQPDIKVIFSSGYAPEILRQKLLIDENVPVAYKPISPTELLRQVRSVLDA